MKETQEINQDRISRREFFKMAGQSALAGILIGANIKLATRESLEGTPNGERDLTLEPVNLTEAELLISDIKKYRKSIGLNGLPPGLAERFSKNVSWESEPPPFENDLPKLLQSFGDMLEEINTDSLGTNHTRLIRGVEVNENSPYGLAFNTGSRKCLMALNLHDYPIYGEFIDIALHEALGHGTDPALSAEYPRNVLLKVERGKWRALSQAFSVEGQFLNHPGDLMYPRLKRNIGADLGFLYLNNELDNDLQANEVLLLNNLIETTVYETGQNPQSIKFNKKFCSMCGEKLIELVKSRRIELRGFLQEKYSQNLEGILGEIYAEMIKYALIYPDAIRQNEDVIRGVESIFSAIRGETVKIEDLREAILEINPEDLKRNKEESYLLSNLKPSEGVMNAIEEIQEFDGIEEELALFRHQGKVPERFSLSFEESNILSKYASVCTQVVQKHPDVINRNDNFDPLLHIWEIWNIESAVNDVFIRSLLNKPESIGENLEEIQRRTEVLENFVNSAAF